MTRPFAKKRGKGSDFTAEQLHFRSGEKRRATKDGGKPSNSLPH
ncbi:hypothetical protein [Roseiconus lacunae]|uniref:Uncharacterized protein n=1 Tax=Roseiconus lacunae TaxID=2605694 RepID=A0ABT7PDB4_9BACT|nr:hypothetical protein [Roseiconus lacunae]MDM4014499.1 hypothetical protein [Roseiconus lacunae]